MSYPSAAARASALERLRAVCLSLPETSERLSHGAPTFFVRGKTSFLMLLDNHHGDGRFAVWCAAEPGTQEALVAGRPRPVLPAAVRRPPRLARRARSTAASTGTSSPASPRTRSARSRRRSCSTRSRSAVTAGPHTRELVDRAERARTAGVDRRGQPPVLGRIELRPRQALPRPAGRRRTGLLRADRARGVRRLRQVGEEEWMLPAARHVERRGRRRDCRLQVHVSAGGWTTRCVQGLPGSCAPDECSAVVSHPARHVHAPPSGLARISATQSGAPRACRAQASPSRCRRSRPRRRAPGRRRSRRRLADPDTGRFVDRAKRAGASRVDRPQNAPCSRGSTRNHVMQCHGRPGRRTNLLRAHRRRRPLLGRPQIQIREQKRMPRTLRGVQTIRGGAIVVWQVHASPMTSTTRCVHGSPESRAARSTTSDDPVGVQFAHVHAPPVARIRISAVQSRCRAEHPPAVSAPGRRSRRAASSVTLRQASASPRGGRSRPARPPGRGRRRAGLPLRAPPSLRRCRRGGAR